MRNGAGDMKSTNRWVSRSLIAVGLLATAVLLSDCGRVRRSWTEDVRLDDGSVIKIKRRVTFEESNSLSGDSYAATEIKSIIKFTGDMRKLPSWSVPLVPILLYKDKKTNEWTIVARSNVCKTWRRRGKPRPPYWEFRLRGDAWSEVALSETSIGRRSNLFKNYYGKLHVSHITTDLREAYESQGRRFENMDSVEQSYLVVLREVKRYSCGS